MKLRMQITKDKDIRFISHLEYGAHHRPRQSAVPSCLLHIPKALIRI